MEKITGNTKIDRTQIECDGIFNVTLALKAQPDIKNNPYDVVLVLDRSGSMEGEPLSIMKEGAKSFIEIFEKSTDGLQDGIIGFGSSVGMVSFSNSATIDEMLTQDAIKLKTSVDALVSEGNTNHGDSFKKAMQVFDYTTTTNKAIILFTDGKTNIGPDPAPIAEELKDKNVEIFCIGLSGEDGADEEALNAWASYPTSKYVSITDNLDDIKEIFENIAVSIVSPGATNIEITETVTDDFEIVSIIRTTKGVSFMKDKKSVQWGLDKLGEIPNEKAELEFSVKHVGDTSGDKVVLKDTEYLDEEGNDVNFPKGNIDVTCDNIIIVEPCPPSMRVRMDGCEDFMVIDAGDIHLSSQGRIVQIDLKLKDICPEKRVALAVILYEKDNCGIYQPRGMKTVTIPKHHARACSDIMVKCINFILPADVDMSCCGESSMCETRMLKVKCLAHYIDTDFICCESKIDIC